MKFLRNAVEQKFGWSEAEPYTRCYRQYRAIFGFYYLKILAPHHRSTGRAEVVKGKKCFSMYTHFKYRPEFQLQVQS